MRRAPLSKLKAAIVLSATIMILSMPQPAAAAGTAVVTATGPSPAISSGQQFTVSIDVNPNNAIAGMQFDLSFNPSLVTVNNVTEGSLLKQGGANTYFNPGQISNSAGTVTGVSGVIISPGQTVSAVGTFAVITMTASSGIGTSLLSLSNVIVGDINGHALSVNAVNGQVVINTPPSITTSSLPNGTVGVAYTQTLAVTGGTTPYTWAIASGTLPAGLSLSSGGVISGTPTAAGGPTSVTFRVTDSGSATATKVLSITINTPPSITTSSLPNGTVGVAYTQTLAATGGTTPYTWGIASGTLPAGLALSSGGVISGTPTAAGGPSSVTFRMTDSGGATATKVLSITINTPPSITTSSLPNGTVGVAYTQTLVATGGTTPYTWAIASGTLPAGLLLSSGGVVSGTPTTAGGPTSVTFQVNDSGGATATKSLSISVYAAWDVNTDGAVNVLDLVLTGQHFGETGTPSWIREDVNGDGTISVLDSILVGQHWTG
jgi:hypothetical protein